MRFPGLSGGCSASRGGGGGFSQILLLKHLGRCLPPLRPYLPHTPGFGHPVSGPQCRVRLGWGRKVLGSSTKDGGLWVRSEGAGIRDMKFKEGTAPRMLSVPVKLVLIDGGVPSPLNPSLSLLSSLRAVPPSDPRTHLFLDHFPPGFVSTLGFPGCEGIQSADGAGREKPGSCCVPCNRTDRWTGRHAHPGELVQPFWTLVF